MKIGIITKHRIRNYGSFMQAYGLQRTIEKLGHDVEIIDYLYPNPVHNTYVSIKGRIRHWGNYILKNTLPGRPGMTFEKRYKNCHDKYYHLSKPYPTQQSIMREPPVYDLYVTGSDQIWRPKFTNGDPVFFADFAPVGCKRIAFSSSFGCIDIDAEYVELYKRLLNKFHRIAVREASGVDIVKKLVNKNCDLVIDPSMLLTALEWSDMLVAPSQKRKYVLCYGGSNKAYLKYLAHEYADRKGYEVVVMNGTFFDYFSKNEKHVLDAGPLEWLGWIKNAQATFIGGSFHGTAFSILFNIPFLSVLTGNKDHDTRQLSMLNDLGLNGNGIIGGTAVSHGSIDGKLMHIDWSSANVKLGNKREETLRLLRDYIDSNITING